jgi:hypothetical protein
VGTQNHNWGREGERQPGGPRTRTQRAERGGKAHSGTAGTLGRASKFCWRETSQDSTRISDQVGMESELRPSSIVGGILVWVVMLSLVVGVFMVIHNHDHPQSCSISGGSFSPPQLARAACLHVQSLPDSRTDPTTARCPVCGCDDFHVLSWCVLWAASRRRRQGPEDRPHGSGRLTRWLCSA